MQEGCSFSKDKRIKEESPYKYGEGIEQESVTNIPYPHKVKRLKGQTKVQRIKKHLIMSKKDYLRTLFAIAVLLLEGYLPNVSYAQTQETPVITMTTSRKAGEKIRLGIRSEGEIRIEGVEEEAETMGQKEYTLTQTSVSIYGDIRELGCNSNQLASLDVSKNTGLRKLSCVDNQPTELDVSMNTKLKELWCFSNQIKGEAMTKLIEGLTN